MRVRADERGYWVWVAPGKEIGPHATVEALVQAVANDILMEVRMLRRILQNHVRAHSLPWAPPEELSLPERIGLTQKEEG